MKPFLALVSAGIAQQATPLQLLNAGGGRGAGLLLPRALNERQQSQMYDYVCANARGTQEWQNLQLDAGTLACDERDMFKTPIPAERPLPLLVHKHLTRPAAPRPRSRVGGASARFLGAR